MPPRHRLELRPGARYACVGDGLCCSDIHALGPVTRAEAARVRGFDSKAIENHPRLALPVLAVHRDHTCTFWSAQGGCAIHRDHGEAAKPTACRQFPYGLVRTEAGLRVTTAHRCPCRSVGPRPLLDERDAREALTTRGRLRVDHTVGSHVRLSRRRHVSFASYAALEANALAALEAPDGLARVVPSADPLPDLVHTAPADLAHAYRALVDGTLTGDAFAWFGDALLAIVLDRRLGDRPRPWAFAFDRAERRVTSPRAREEVFADFAADVLYGLAWVEASTLASTLVTLGVALRAASRVAARIERTGASSERAAAEAVLVAEVGLAGPLARIRASDEDEASALDLIAALSPQPSAATRRSARRS
ncbi:MAG: hypothetical protein U0235_32975 [Polyangiaceae bacterium]